jgi:hypothetical protein
MSLLSSGNGPWRGHAARQTRRTGEGRRYVTSIHLGKLATS